MNNDPSTLLLVEDNDDDVFIFSRAYKQAQLTFGVQIARDGQEAIDYLTGAGKFADRAAHPQPFLVLLDLKLPLRHGLEVLEAMRARPELAGVFVVVLTSSAEQRDIARAHELGARSYLVKPPRAKTLQAVIEAARAGCLDNSIPWPKIEGDMFEDLAAAGERAQGSSQPVG